VTNMNVPRSMVFVDGENLTIRGQALASAHSLDLEVDPQFFLRNVFAWLPKYPPDNVVMNTLGARGLLRSYYYTSVVGDDAKMVEVRDSLRKLRFDPQVFKKASGSAKSKGVDIALTKDMLSHAFRNNYDAAVLVAGDADYLPLIDEVKRLGKTVCVSFFAGSGLAEEIPRVVDRFFDLSPHFIEHWTNLIRLRKGQ
jgi:uncharacterized LabA/DUF88 family protein